MEGSQIQLQYPSAYHYQNQDKMLKDAGNAPPPEPPTATRLLMDIANEMTTPRGRFLFGVPALAISIVLYFAVFRKTVESWPWYAKFALWIAIYFSVTTATALIAFALPGSQDQTDQAANDKLMQNQADNINPDDRISALTSTKPFTPGIQDQSMG